MYKLYWNKGDFNVSTLLTVEGPFQFRETCTMTYVFKWLFSWPNSKHYPVMYSELFYQCWQCETCGGIQDAFFLTGETPYWFACTKNRYFFLKFYQNLLLKVVPTSHYKDTWNIKSFKPHLLKLSYCHHVVSFTKTNHIYISVHH